MNNNCQLVVFSNKAYNAIIRESFDKDPVETGGILLGHVLDNGMWIVMEVLPPGINSIFQYAYFEYDDVFVNYLAQSVANQYKCRLDLLGLWHRHPGSMDVFSTTDDETNTTFARQNPAGAISALINIDPDFRLTMYHLDRPTHRILGRPVYSKVDIEVGDDIIPEEYFELRYYNGGEQDLHPNVCLKGQERRIHRILKEEQTSGVENPSQETLSDSDPAGLDIKEIIRRGLEQTEEGESVEPQNEENASQNDFFSFWRASKIKKWYILLIAIALIIGAFSFRSCKNSVKGISSWVKEWTKKENTDSVPEPKLSMESVTLKIGETSKTLTISNLPKDTKVEWKSSNKNIISVTNGVLIPHNEGIATVSANYTNGTLIGECVVTVEKPVLDKAKSVTDNLDDKSFDPKVTLTFNEGNIRKGESAPVPITKEGSPIICYSSSDNSIVSVSDTGILTGLQKGTVTITIISGRETLNYKVTVK